MARSFIGFGQQQYIGTPYSIPFDIYGKAGKAVPLNFNWISYGASSAVPNINVLLNVKFGQAPLLQRINSIYIDNTNSNVPIYIYFPDTGYTIVQAPNSEGWHVACTNSFSFWVIAEGFVTGQIPSTVIIATDLPVQENTDYELQQQVALFRASQSITRGTTIYSKNVGAPFLGDQIEVDNVSLTMPSTVAILRQTSTGIIGITGVVAKGIQCSNVGGFAGCIVTINSAEGTPLFSWDFTVTAGSGSAQDIDVFSLTGMNLILDATQHWQLNNTGANISNGFVQLTIIFTDSLAPI